MLLWNHVYIFHFALGSDMFMLWREPKKTNSQRILVYKKLKYILRSKNEEGEKKVNEMLHKNISHQDICFALTPNK